MLRLHFNSGKFKQDEEGIMSIAHYQINFFINMAESQYLIIIPSYKRVFNKLVSSFLNMSCVKPKPKGISIVIIKARVPPKDKRESFFSLKK